MVQDSFKMALRWSKMAKGPKRAPKEPKTGQDCPRIAQDGPNMAPRWAKMLPRRPQDQDTHRWPQEAPKLLQDGPRWLQDGPRCLKDFQFLSNGEAPQGPKKPLGSLYIWQNKCCFRDQEQTMSNKVEPPNRKRNKMKTKSLQIKLLK